VIAKVEGHPGELYLRVGFIVTTLTRPAARVVAIYNQRGTAEQYIKEGKNAVKWTRLSCRSCRAMEANAVRLQLHALAYNLSNFLRTLALPEEMESWSLTTIRETVVKIGAKVIAHARYAVFQMAEVAVPRDLFHRILGMIDDLRPREPAPCQRQVLTARSERQAECVRAVESRYWGRSRRRLRCGGGYPPRHSAFRGGRNHAILPSIRGRWAAYLGNAG
jgi:hypothetical protein